MAKISKKVSKLSRKGIPQQVRDLRKSQVTKGLLGVFVISLFVLLSVISGEAMMGINFDGYGYGYGYYTEIIQVPDDFPTIQSAIDAAPPEETVRIMVAPGTYQENLVLKENIGLYTKAPGVIIQGATSGNIISNVCNNVIDGFNIVNPVFTLGTAIEVSPACSIDKSIIQNNILDGQGEGTSGITVGRKTVVSNNTIMNFRGGLDAQGVTIKDGRPKIQNNIIMNNYNNIGCTAEVERPIIEYNDLWNPGVADWVGDCGHHPDNLYVDPLFVDEASEDYHLQATSPLIDAGFKYVVTLTDYDYDKNSRVVDGDFDGQAKIDIGADEYRLEYTTVEGTISSDTTWTAGDSPYKVVGNITVKEGATLTVAPGVRVEFDGFYHLMIYGELKVLGTLDNKVVFTSGRETPAPGNWSGVIFEDPSIDAVLDKDGKYISGSIIANAEFSYGTRPIHVTYSSPYIFANYLHHHNGSAISLYYSGAVVRNNQISDNSGKGIYLYDYYYYYPLHEPPQIVANSITNNSDSGVYLSHAYQVRIEDNYIADNRGYQGAGIRVYSSDGTEILNNIIVGNEAYSRGGGIQADYSALTIESNTIKDNVCTSAYDNEGGSALSINNYHNATIEKNNIINNLGPRAILISSNPDIEMHQNNIFNPEAEYEVYLYNTSEDINAEENYWGTTRLVKVWERTYDQEEDPDLGKIKVWPIKFGPIPFE